MWCWIPVSILTPETTRNGRTKIIQEDGSKTIPSYRTLPPVPPFKKLLFKVKETQMQNQQSFGKTYCKEHLNYVCVDPMGHLLKPNFAAQHFLLAQFSDNRSQLSA